MTKRSYPFQDCSYRLLKCHVTEKLMRSAMNALPNHNNNIDQSKSKIIQETQSRMSNHGPNQQAVYKQLQFGHNGQLSMKNGNNLKHIDLSSACVSCRNKINASNSSICDFCEKFICDKCAQLCVCCSGNFCQLCSLISYDRHFESVTCLSCLS